MTITSFRYLGGKAGVGGRSGPWIRSLLPHEPRGLYVETHAGMLGILMQRQPVRCEIVNDLNGRISNWWRVVRDRPDDIARLIAHTPRCRDIFDEALEGIDEGDDVTRAYRFFVVVMQSLMHGDGEGMSWAKAFDGKADPHYEERIAPMARRLRGVQVENQPATVLLERLIKESHAVVYVDPPYRSAHTSSYAVDQQDYEDTLALLKRQTGRVAVSGYGDEWNDLDWHRHEFNTHMQVSNTAETQSQRTEVLWCNYKPETQMSLVG